MTTFKRGSKVNMFTGEEINVGDTVQYFRSESERSLRTGKVTKVAGNQIWASFNGEGCGATWVQAGYIHNVMRAVEPKVKFNAGDYVMYQRPHDKELPGKVTSAKDGVYLVDIIIHGGTPQQLPANLLRKADEEEVIEFRRNKALAVLGRSPKEIKKGDIVRVTDGCAGCNRVGDIGVVTEENRHGTDVRVQVDGRPGVGNWSLVQLITPVELRLDQDSEKLELIKK
ncbi:hypothetical protein [Bacillus wiedmannii]|uniref:hypothetical protein n=1 Tax=Bacillus wiedmannii TaxID=1890302 RepID=UPI000BF070F2|nr:hypothetical protein [Bacillus wiedmannii]PEM08542.1 hypothetical protein CN610_20025 [Bacillus wiedmannii]